MGNDAVYQRDEGMVFRRLGEEMVLVPIRAGLGDFDSFYVLNELGCFLWEKLKEPQTLAQLIGLITQEFEVDHLEAERDLRDFLEQLRALKGLKIT